MSHTLQTALESGQEARIVQIDFSAACDRVNHLGILYKLCSVCIEGSVLSILTQFLSNRSQQVWWMVVEVNWLMLYQEYRRAVLEYKLIGYADDYTLMAVVPSPGVRVAVAQSLIRDLAGLVSGVTFWG